MRTSFFDSISQAPKSENLMPALADLDRRMDANPDQREAFDRNEAFAAAIAQRIPLVHVSGKGVPLDDLLTNTPHELPTSAHPT